MSQHATGRHMTGVLFRIFYNQKMTLIRIFRIIQEYGVLVNTLIDTQMLLHTC